MFTALELGTGWYPIFPLACYLSGASKVWSFDIASYQTPARLALTLDYFSRAAQDGSLPRILPMLRGDRVEPLMKLREFVAQEPPEKCLARLNIHLAVKDARETGLPPGSVDFIFSNGVLEYIPGPVLQKIFSEFFRVSSTSSAMVHWLNLSDQFAHFDSSISEFNFLRYSDRAWKWLESPMVSVNRFRVNDYRPYFAEAGFELKAEENKSGSSEKLKSLKLAPRFQGYSVEDLLVVETLLTAVRSAKKSAATRAT